VKGQKLNVLARTFAEQNAVGSSSALCKYLTLFLNRCSLFDMSAYTGIKHICLIYALRTRVAN
jgi:hypothetical protein